MATVSKKEYDERKLFMERLTTLVKSEYEEIYRILKRSNETISENANGIFFNVTDISTETFNKLKAFMDFCMENRNNQDQRIKALEALRNETDSIHTIA
jgi:hypothetical protein